MTTAATGSFSLIMRLRPCTERSASLALQLPPGRSEQLTLTVRSVLNRVRFRLFMLVESVAGAPHVSRNAIIRFWLFQQGDSHHEHPKSSLFDKELPPHYALESFLS